MRLALYMFTLASDDEVTRQLGLVLIVAPNCEQQAVIDPKDHWKVAELMQSIPLRLTAIHVCLPNASPVFHLFRATTVLLFGRDQRVRAKVHIGQ
jgi:hypothetical protein